MLFCRDDLFQNQFFLKYLSGIPSECQKSLGADQDNRLVRPDLTPNCLQRLLAADPSRLG